MTTNWDKTKPSSVEFVSNWPTEATNNWGALEDALGREHTFPGNQGTTAGQHRAATESVTGTARFATAAEIAAGSDDTVMVSPLGLQTGLSGTGQTRYGRLKVYNNAGTPASKIDLTASSLLLTDGGTPVIPFRVTDVSLTIDGTVTGANGLDTGSLSVGWYYLYVIAYIDGSSVLHVSGLLSTSASAPILPTNYIYYGLFSSIYYYQDPLTSAYQFRKIRQYNNKVNHTGICAEYDSGSSTWLYPGSMYTSAELSWTSKDISAFVPPNGLTAIMQPYGGSASGGIYHAIAWDGTPTNECPLTGGSFALFDGIKQTMSPFTYVLNPAAPQTIYAKSYDGTDRGGSFLKGYELDI